MNHIDDSQACVVCREGIKLGAIKCIHCGSFQSGWQKYIGFSSTVLALLIALISVLQASLPTFIDIAKGRYTKVSLSFVSADEKQIVFIATNAGTEVGAIGFSHVEVETEIPIDLLLSLRPDDVIMLHPGEFRTVVAEYMRGPLEPLVSSIDEYPAKARLTVTNFDGNTETAIVPLKLICAVDECGFENAAVSLENFKLP